jgi:hypothetical protein
MKHSPGGRTGPDLLISSPLSYLDKRYYQDSTVLQRWPIEDQAALEEAETKPPLLNRSQIDS